MSETAQFFIIGVITILTIVITMVGFQAYMLLKELRESVKTSNHILTEVDDMTTKLSHSADSVSGMFDGLRAAVSLIGAFKKSAEHDEQQK